MSFLFILLVMIPSCLAFTLKQIEQNDELYVVKYPTQNELTCLSEDDDAALVWNDDLSTREPSDDFNNFEPVKPMGNILMDSECAIWKSRQCFTEWSRSDGWKIVSALTDPMAPVYDFRWEGFKEHVVHNVESKNVLSLDAGDRTIIFSIRGTNDVQIHLCKDTMVGLPSCPVIKFAVDGVYSSIEYCESRETGCHEKILSETRETAFLNADEWRTFRLQWIKNERNIKVFRDTYKQVYLQSSLRELHNIFISSSAVARIRFHDYNYILSTNPDSIMTTKEFNWSDDLCCVNMLISLCRECYMTVSLIDSSVNTVLASIKIRRDDRFYSSGLREWQPVKLTSPSESSSRRQVQLRFRTGLDDEYQEDIWWAIDDLRLCEQNDGVRKSTIKIPRSDQTGVGTSIKCQKLLRGTTAVADLSTSLPPHDTTRLSGYVKNLPKSYFPGCRGSSTTNCDDIDSTSDRKNEAAPPADNKSPSKQIKTWRVGLILILGICPLLLILLIWYRKHKKTKTQTIGSRGVPPDLRTSIPVNSRVRSSGAQDLPSDPVHTTSSENLERQTSSAQNVPFEPPYMISRDLSEQASHLQKVASAPVYTNISNDSMEESSHAQNVPSDPEYWEILDNSREQPSHPQDVALAPIYMNTLENSKGVSSYPRDASLDPEYLIILDDSRGETSYAQDISLAPVYMNILDNSREQIRHAHDTP